MKSRVILLAAMLFAIPAFGEENGEPTPQKETSVELSKNDTDNAKETPSWLSLKLATVTGAGATVVGYTLAPVANWTTIPVLNQFLHINYLKGGNFEKYIPTVGKTVVGLALVGAIVKGYRLLTAEADDVDADDDDQIFGN